MKTSGHLEGGRAKIYWSGKVISVQPRIRLTRSFDQRSHNYLGYTLLIEGTIVGEQRSFAIGICKEAQSKHQFRAGDIVSGKSEEVRDPRSEASDYYKTSELETVERGTQQESSRPPWIGVPLSLDVYRERVTGGWIPEPTKVSARFVSGVVVCQWR